MTREEVDALVGTTVLEFGASWCGYCQAARPQVDRVLKNHSEIRHIWVEDGKGQRLGRTFGVKLWPTLIVLHDGKEVARVVRPRGESEIEKALLSST